jgi:trans-aconitate methyltransferase
MTYDEAVRNHYDHIGTECGLSPQSTMADSITRRIETDAILTFVSSVAPSGRVADVGCGNGYTLSCLAERFSHLSLTGFDPNRSLRDRAASRFGGVVTVLDGDL